MAAVVAGTLLSEIGFGEAVGAGITDIVGSEVVGTVAGSTAQGIAAQTIGDKVSEAVDSAAASVFGRDTVDSIEQTVKDKVDQAKQEFRDAGFLLTGNYDAWYKAKRDEARKKNANKQIPPADAYQAGKDWAEYCTKHADEIANSSYPPDTPNSKIVDVVMTQNPHLSYLISDIMDLPHIKEKVNAVLPTSDEYKQIAAVYNGRSINRLSVKEQVDSNGQKFFGGLDETGVYQIYKEDPNSFKIPALHGVWVGPSSPNGSLPIDLFDTYAFYHDVSYHNANGGWFNRQGDYQFISRLSQNLDRFPKAQLPLVYATIKYFSTLGHLLSGTNKNNPVPLTGPMMLSKVPASSAQGPNNEGNIVQPSDQQEYMYLFNKGLVTNLVNHTRSSTTLTNNRRIKSPMLQRIKVKLVH